MLSQVATQLVRHSSWRRRNIHDIAIPVPMTEDDVRHIVREELAKPRLSNGMGNWWCPDCGKWIPGGEGRITHDNFMVHERCH